MNADERRCPICASPLVSVIIVNWNGKKYLQPCLESLLAQTYPSVEIILVDNASSDGSVEFVHERYSQVMVVANDKNLGFAGGNNAGFAQARGKYVALLNNDALAAPDWIGQLVRVGEEHIEIGMLASKVRFMTPENTLNSTGTLVYPDLSCINRGMFEKDTGQYDSAFDVFGPYGAAAFYRKQALDEVGWFDSEYFMHREEDDLTWRCRLAGWECRYVPDAVATHLWSASSGGGGSALKLYYGERNRIWNLFKFLPFDMVLASAGPTLRRLWRLRRTLKPTSKLKSSRAKELKSSRVQEFKSSRVQEFESPEAQELKRTRLSRFQIILTLAQAWLAAWLRFPHFRAKRLKTIVRGGSRREMVKKLLKRYGAGLDDIARVQGISG